MELDQIYQTLYEHMLKEEGRLTIIENNIQDLSSKVETLETSVSDLVEAWKTAGGIVTFIKWVAGITTAITAIVAAIKIGFWK